MGRGNAVVCGKRIFWLTFLFFELLTNIHLTILYNPDQIFSTSEFTCKKKSHMTKNDKKFFGVLGSFLKGSIQRIFTP